LSTATFTRLGHVYRGRMIDVQATNEKLRGRAARIVGELTGAEPGAAHRALQSAGGSARLAVVMLLGRLDADEARGRLEAWGGDRDRGHLDGAASVRRHRVPAHHHLASAVGDGSLRARRPPGRDAGRRGPGRPPRGTLPEPRAERRPRSGLARHAQPGTGGAARGW